MTKGVTLIAVGSFGYLQWAVNMAVSIKYHSPGIAISLLTSDFLSTDAFPQTCFDKVTVLPDAEFMDDGKLFPAKLKTNLYKWLAYDENIYLDVDGCIIKDITPLFNIKADLASDVQGIYDLTQGELFNAMKWAKPDVVWFHFGLKPMAKLPAINSSFLFIRKCKANKELYDKAHELLMFNPLPIEQHWHPWGVKRKTKNQQPDELYMNVAMAMLETKMEHCCAIHFRTAIETGPYVPIEEIKNGHYGIGLFGELRSNHLSMQAHYNHQMKEAWGAVVTRETGAPFYNKCENLANSKFAVQ